MRQDLKYVVRKYKRGTINRKELLRSLNKIILRVPAFYKCYNKDIKYEFYSIIAGRLDKLLGTYVEYDNAKFTTWFYRVLNGEFAKFIKNKNKKDYDYKLIERYLSENTGPVTSNDFSSLSLDYSVLSAREKSVLALKFGIPIENRDVEETSKIIRMKIEQKKLIEIKISKYHIKLISLQKQLKHEIHPHKIEELQYKITKTQNTKKRYVSTINTFRILPTNSWVGQQLGITDGTVGAYLNKIKKKMKASIISQSRIYMHHNG